MKKNLFLFLNFLILMICQQASALSIYTFKYDQRWADKIVATEALFLQHESGSGFLKVKYLDPASGSRVLISFSLDEEYIRDGKGGIDQKQLYVRTVEPRVLIGSASAGVRTPIILFKANQQNGLLEPVALMETAKDQSLQIMKEANFRATFIQTPKPEQQSLKDFFTKSDAFLGRWLSNSISRFTPDEMKTMIHLIIVADTLEEDIGISCAHDLHRVLDTYTKVVAIMGARMRVHVVAGDRYNKKHVVSELKLLRPAPNDIVVFYYSGHGYRKKEDKRQYPYIDLRASGEHDYLTQTLNMEDIYQFIKRKGARMNLVLSDCCNSYVGDRNSVSSLPPAKRSSTLMLDGENIRMLFLKGKISILATAADSTQRASSNNSLGGFFSYYLNASLEASASSSKTAVAKANSSPVWWHDVLSEARAQTEKKAQYTYCDKPYTAQNICKQSPCFKIE